jgi:hypothetical protein
MLNVYLGLAAATRDAAVDYGCALADLEQTRTQANLWQAAFHDPDIAADLVLIDQFEANLRAHGATDGATLDGSGACVPSYEGGYGYGDEDGHRHGLYACASGGGRGGASSALVVAAAAWLASRRRRRLLS